MPGFHTIVSRYTRTALSGILLRCWVKGFRKAELFQNIITHDPWFPRSLVEFSGLSSAASRCVVLRPIQDGGAFTKLKQIIPCKLHGISLCFYAGRIAYNNEISSKFQRFVNETVLALYANYTKSFFSTNQALEMRNVRREEIYYK